MLGTVTSRWPTDSPGTCLWSSCAVGLIGTLVPIPAAARRPRKALPHTSPPMTLKLITAMPGDFGAIRPVGLKVVVEVHPLDDDANSVLDLHSDDLSGVVQKAIDQALAAHITGQWACAIHVSRLVG